MLLKLGIFILVSALGCFAIFKILFMQSYVKELVFEGQTINITRDYFNIPHIKAPSRNAAYFGLGYVSAEDRLFQMHMKKMVSLGRLSELAGSRTLPIDKMFRAVGIKKNAEKAAARFKLEDPDHYGLYQAYSDGINEYVKQNGKPLTFFITRFEVYEWTVSDCLALNALLNWGQASDIGGEFLRSLLSRNMTLEQIDEIVPFKEDYVLMPKSTIVSDEELKAAGLFQYFKKKEWKDEKIYPISGVVDTGYSDFGGYLEVGASNSWVISGKLSSTGKPLMANDPHLYVTIPSYWYQFYVEFPKKNGKPFWIKGAAIAGSLANLIGKTNYVSWGCTNVYTDTQDMYKEKLNDEKTHYMLDGYWKQLKIRKEIIKISDAPDLVYEVKETHRGPLMEYVYFWTHIFKVDYHLSLAWTANHDRFEIAAEAMEVVYAYTYEELLNVFNTKLNDAPPINLVYITADGHIGLQNIGSYPLLYNPDMSGFIKDGTTSKNDWIGMLRGKDRMHIEDPEKGYIVTANNRLVSRNFANGRYSANWIITARAIRITEMIEQAVAKNGKVSIEDCKEIQLDTVDWFCRYISPHLKPLDSEFYKMFANWTCNFTEKSGYASYYSMFMHKLQKKLKPSNIPVEGHHFFNHYTYRYLLNLTKNSRYISLIRDSLKEARYELQSFYMGTEIKSWPWGKLHRDFMEHRPLSKTPLATLFYKYSPGRGNYNTPNVALMRKISYGDWSCNHRAGIRMITTYDYGKSEWIIDSGSSYNILSEHYDNQYKIFMKDGYLSMDLDHAQESNYL